MSTSNNAPATDVLQPYIANLRFRAYTGEQKSAKKKFLGYVNGTLTVPGTAFELEVYGLEVSVLNGKPRLDFPSEKRDGTWYPHFRPSSKETRDDLTAQLFAVPEIALAAEPFLGAVVTEEAPVIDMSNPQVQAAIAALAAQLVAGKMDVPA